MSRRYALEFAPQALRKLDRPMAGRIKAATESLRDDPRPTGAKMLTGMHGVLRIRVAGDYRVLYTVDDDRLVVLVVDGATGRSSIVSVSGYGHATSPGGVLELGDALHR